MKRWVVRLPTLADGTPLPDIIVRAETMSVEEGALIFDTDTKIVRAFGVGMWHNVEPLADVPEGKSWCLACGHSRGMHHWLGSPDRCRIATCLCGEFTA